MSKQYNKAEKQKRRLAYVKRKKARAKAGPVAKTKKAAAAPAAAPAAPKAEAVA